MAVYLAQNYICPQIQEYNWLTAQDSEDINP